MCSVEPFASHAPTDSDIFGTLSNERCSACGLPIGNGTVLLAVGSLVRLLHVLDAVSQGCQQARAFGKLRRTQYFGALGTSI